MKPLGVLIAKKDVPFLMANDQPITRDIGYAIIRVESFETVGDVVFAKKGDLKLLGSRTLEDFAATVEPRRKKFVAAGPILAA